MTAGTGACFGAVVATLMFRTACGEDVAESSPVADDAFVEDLAETVVRYLMASYRWGGQGETSFAEPRLTPPSSSWTWLGGQ